MNEFSTLIIPINDSKKGLLRFSILPKPEVLDLVFEAHRLMIDYNDQMSQTIMNNIIDTCNRNPFNNDQLFNSVSSKMFFHKVFNYRELEDVDFEFSNKLTECENNLREQFGNNILDQLISFQSDKLEFKCKLFYRDLRRIYRYVHSLLENYTFLLDTIKYVNREIKEEAKEIKQDEEKLFVEEKEIKLETVSKTLIDKILEYILVSPAVFRYLIHLIYNFYRYFRLSEYREDCIRFQCLLPSNLGLNRDYFLGLLEAINLVSIEKINLLTKNFVKFIQEIKDDLSPLETQICVYILFFFGLRHISEQYKEWLISNLDRIFTEEDSIEKLLNRFIPKIVETDLKFELIRGEELDLVGDLPEISKKYDYLRGLDQEKFAELVLGEGNNHPPNLPKIGIKTIINLESYWNQPEKKSSELIQEKYPYGPPILLNYKKSPDKIITNAFQVFLNFLDNPISLVTDKHNLSNDIINTFEKLRSLLNDINFPSDDISTLSYYEKLTGVLPEDYLVEDTLYIIYQIIIPYMYYVHGQTIYEDYFLNLIKI